MKNIQDKTLNKMESLLVTASDKTRLKIMLALLDDSLCHCGHCEEEHECHTHHHENTPAHAHLIHPLIHALQILAYVFVINLALGLIIGFVTEEKFSAFMISNRYLAPLFSSIIGLIPNCASSILITKLFAEGQLSFGALFAGLLVNSGLGLTVLLKDKKTIGKALIILAICFVIANILGYVTCLVVGF